MTFDEMATEIRRMAEADPAKYRYDLTRTYVVAGHEYATDAHICIRRPTVLPNTSPADRPIPPVTSLDWAIGAAFGVIDAHVAGMPREDATVQSSDPAHWALVDSKFIPARHANLLRRCEGTLYIPQGRRRNSIYGLLTSPAAEVVVAAHHPSSDPACGVRTDVRKHNAKKGDDV